MADIKFQIVVDSKSGQVSIRQLDKSIKGLGGAATKTSPKLKGMWKQMAAGIGITAGATLAVRSMVRQIKDVFRTGREFEKEWANVTTMLNISRGETRKMRDELRRLSPTLGDTADLAKGMYQVLSASIEPAKAIEFLGVAAKAAKAGVTDTKTAVDAITTVINAYGLEAEDATDISDIMFSTVKRGKLTFEEMAGSLGTIVPVASKLGLRFNEIAGAMSTLTRQGIDSRTATMQLRQVLMSILNPTEEAQILARNLGFEWSTSALKAKGLSGLLKELEKGTRGSNKLLSVFVPNVRALTAVMGLAGKAAKGFAEDVELTENALGLTNEAFEKQAESMDFWIEAFGVASDKIKSAFYEGLVDPIRESIKTTEDFEKVFTEKTNAIADEARNTASEIMKIGAGFVKAIEFIDWWVFSWADAGRKRKKIAKETAKEIAKVETEAMKIREGLIEDDILTAEEWTAMYEKHGERYDRVLHAIATHPDYENIRNRWKEVEEEIKAATDIPDKEIIIKIIPKLEMPEFDFPELPENEVVAHMKEIAMVTETELGAIMENIMAIPEGATSVIQGVLEETQGLFNETGLSAEQLASQTKGMTEAQKEFSGVALEEFMVMEASLKGFVGAMLNTLERWAIGEIIPLAMKSAPFPINLAITGGAILAVKALFAGIKGMEKGGWVGEHGPEIIKVGERGREYVVSNAMTRNTNNIYNQGGSQPLRITIMNRIDIGEHTLYKTTVHNINKAGELRDITIPNQVVL